MPRAQSETMPQPHSARSNFVTFDFSSSLPHVSRSPSSHAAIPLYQQHQNHHYQCQQSSPLLPVMEMLSQQMQQHSNQGSMELEARSSHDVPRRVQNRGRK